MGVNLNVTYDNFDHFKSYDMFNSEHKTKSIDPQSIIILQVGNVFVENAYKSSNLEDTNRYIHIIVKESVKILNYDVVVDDLIYNVINTLYSDDENNIINIALPNSYNPIVQYLSTNDRIYNSTFAIINKLLERARLNNYKIKFL